MAETELIRGAVAEILNSRELVINRGTEQGVTLGMKFAVLEPRGLDIEDPETGEPLGSIGRTKVQVQVVSVHDKLCVASTFKKSRVNVGGTGFGFGSSKLFEPPKYETRWETFKTEDASWEPINEKDSIVQVGDPVEQVFEPVDESS